MGRYQARTPVARVLSLLYVATYVVGEASIETFVTRHSSSFLINKGKSFFFCVQWRWLPQWMVAATRHIDLPGTGTCRVESSRYGMPVDLESKFCM